MSNVLLMLFAIAVQASFTTTSPRVDGRTLAARECPTIMMSCPDDLSDADGVPLTVSVTWQKTSTSNLTYEWKVMKGEIISGQGTESIKVKLPPETNSLIATVVVGGLPSECSNTASCSIIVN